MSDLDLVKEDLESDMSSGPPPVLSRIFDMIVAGFRPLRSEPLYVHFERKIQIP